MTFLRLPRARNNDLRDVLSRINISVHLFYNAQNLEPADRGVTELEKKMFSYFNNDIVNYGECSEGSIKEYVKKFYNLNMCNLC